MTSGLTRVTCECCGNTEDDGVAHMLIWEAAVVYQRGVEAKQDRDREAWAAAEEAVARAQAGV